MSMLDPQSCTYETTCTSTSVLGDLFVIQVAFSAAIQLEFLLILSNSGTK